MCLTLTICTTAGQPTQIYHLRVKDPNNLRNSCPTHPNLPFMRLTLTICATVDQPTQIYHLCVLPSQFAQQLASPPKSTIYASYPHNLRNSWPAHPNLPNYFPKLNTFAF
jgi:uncharacterized lipoprotein YmbA